MAPFSLLRFGSNLCVLLVLATAILLGLHQLASWRGWTHDPGCWIQPALVTIEALGARSVLVGVLLLLAPWCRSLGLGLIAISILLIGLPDAFSGHLDAFCRLN